MVSEVIASKVDREQLREQIEAKYCDVAQKPEQGFHFSHAGMIVHCFKLEQVILGRTRRRKVGPVRELRGLIIGF